MDESRIEEEVVAETTLPERRGSKAERRGSTLCLSASTWKSRQKICAYFVLCNASEPLAVWQLRQAPCSRPMHVKQWRIRNHSQGQAGWRGRHHWLHMRLSPLLPSELVSHCMADHKTPHGKCKGRTCFSDMGHTGHNRLAYL